MGVQRVLTLHFGGGIWDNAFDTVLRPEETSKRIPSEVPLIGLEPITR